MTEKNETPLKPRNEQLASQINEAIFRVTGCGVSQLAAIDVLGILNRRADHAPRWIPICPNCGADFTRDETAPAPEERK